MWANLKNWLLLDCVQNFYFIFDIEKLTRGFANSAQNITFVIEGASVLTAKIQKSNNFVKLEKKVLL